VSVLLVGIGSAGIGIAADVHAQLGHAVVAMGTDQGSLDETPIERKLLLGRNTCKGNSASSVEQAQAAAQESVEQIREQLQGYQQLVVFTALGGGTGTGAIPVVAAQAQQMGMQVLLLVALPFSFEQEQRQIALAALEQLQAQYQVKVLENQQAEQGLEDVFAGQSKRAIELVRQL